MMISTSFPLDGGMPLNNHKLIYAGIAKLLIELGGLVQVADASSLLSIPVNPCRL